MQKAASVRQILLAPMYNYVSGVAAHDTKSDQRTLSVVDIQLTDARPLYWGPFPLSHSSADVVMCCLVVDVVIGLGYDGKSFRGLRDLAHVRGPRDCPWNARGISNTRRAWSSQAVPWSATYAVARANTARIRWR